MTETCRPVPPAFAAPLDDAAPGWQNAPPHPGRFALLRPALVKIVLAEALIAGLLLSPNLWMSGRAYPLVPVADWLPVIAPPADRICYFAMLVLLAAIVVAPRARTLMWVLVGLLGGVCMLDQSRWQPWVFQYLAMLAALAAAAWPRRSDPPEERRAAIDRLLNPCRVILAFTYLYSGLHKLNEQFHTSTGPWLLAPALRVAPPWLGERMMEWRGAIPWIEAGIGAALLLRWTRPLAALAAVVMHAGILWTLLPQCRFTPHSHDWNSIVWPWNAAMILLVPLLFMDVRRRPLVPLLIGPWRSVYPKVVLLLFGVAPALSFIGKWDLYLSAALYSGETPQVRLEFDAAVHDALPPRVQKECYAVDYTWTDTGEMSPSRYEVNVMMWSIAEMNVPDYPADRVFQGIARELSRRQGGGEVVLTIDSLRDRSSAERETNRFTFRRGLTAPSP